MLPACPCPTHGPSVQQLSLATNISRLLRENKRYISSSIRVRSVPNPEGKPQHPPPSLRRAENPGSFALRTPQRCSRHTDLFTDLPSAVCFEHPCFILFPKAHPVSEDPSFIPQGRGSPRRGFPARPRGRRGGGRALPQPRWGCAC